VWITGIGATGNTLSGLLYRTNAAGTAAVQTSLRRGDRRRRNGNTIGGTVASARM